MQNERPGQAPAKKRETGEDPQALDPARSDIDEVQFDPGPPPIQWGIGRSRVPPALNKDGRRRSGDYVLGAVRIQAEASAESGDLLNGPDHRHANNWME